MTKAPFFLPIENQVRELDAKLLLACVAADRGHDAYLGWKDSIHSRLHRLPTGVYFSKSLSARAVKVLKISQRLGHKVVAWDEEAVVHYPPEVYYSRRMSADAVDLTDLLLTWGDDNKALFEGFPAASAKPIRVVGNPRVDLLRPELRPYFDEQVRNIKRQYGDFILINTNFGTINGYYPGMNVCYEDARAPGGLALGRGAKGFSREFALRLFAYRTQVLDKIRQMVPELARAFPDVPVVLRPHPAENRDTWRELLQDIGNVSVEATGNVVPWLLASSVLIHNGCTTAVEGYILQRPVVAYVPVAEGDEFAIDPPNTVSDVAVTVTGVIDKVAAILSGNGEPVNDSRRGKVLSRFISSLDGDFAAQRILDQVSGHLHVAQATHRQRILGSVSAHARQVATSLKSVRNVERFSSGFKQQRFPDVTVESLLANARTLAELACLKSTPGVERMAPDLFRIARG